MKILYFSWLREKIGLDSGNQHLESGDVNELVEFLKKSSENIQLLFKI